MGSVAGVVGVSFEDGEGAVDLFEEHDAGEFVGQCHFAQGKGGGGGLAGGVGKTVGGADGQDQRLGVAILMVFQELGEFLGGELAAAGVEQNDGMRRTGSRFLAEFQEGGFVAERYAFDVGVTLDAPEVLGGQGLDGGIFGFADPGYFEFHGSDLNTGDTEEHGDRKAFNREGR